MSRGSHPNIPGLRRVPDELVRRSFAAWLLWSHPTLGTTGVVAAWRALTPRARNAWRLAIASARDEAPPHLEPE